jgi:translocation and assembly module TamB
MAFTRSLLGLDDIKVGSAEEGGMQVGLGKYLTDDIYVEVEKGLTSDKDTLSVEMEVTPHIEVETEVGTDSNGKVGLNWKWEY